jgi:hypothetical protein
MSNVMLTLECPKLLLTNTGIWLLWKSNHNSDLEPSKYGIFKSGCSDLKLSPRKLVYLELHDLVNGLRGTDGGLAHEHETKVCMCNFSVLHTERDGVRNGR